MPIWAKREQKDVGCVMFHCNGYWALYYDWGSYSWRCPVCHRILLYLTQDGVPKGDTNS